MKTKIFFFLLLALQIVMGVRTLQASPPIALNPTNPHYFLFRGQPTVLVASTEHYGSVVNLDFDYLTYLNEISSKNLNYTRMFAGSYVEYQGWFGIPNNTLAPAANRYLAPWPRSSTPGYTNGGNKFDLSQFDPAYFARLQDFVSQASSRGIVVEVSLFCNYYTTQLWQLSPLYEGNNINGINGGGGDAAFAYSLNNGNLGPVQDAYVKKMITALNGYDNVVYEICNELYDTSTYPWQQHIADVITQTETTLPNKHLITQNINNGATTISNPDTEVSVFNYHYATSPDAVADNVGLPDVIGFDETGTSGSADIIYRHQGWDFLMSGGGLFDNLDYSFTVASPVGATNQPSAPGGGSPDLRTQLGVLHSFMSSIDFLHMTPDTSVITGGVPSGAKVWGLSKAGQQYAVFLEGPNGNNVANLVANIPAGTYLAEWVNTHTGSVDKSETFTHPGGNRTIVSPTYLDDIALRITLNGTGGGGGGNLPSPWLNQDIGSVGVTGSASYSNGTFTVAGGGADIWGTADAFQYAYQAVSGDGSITAHVATQTNTNANAKAAVMIRSDLSAGSAHAMMDVSPGGGLEFICRSNAGAGASRPNAVNGTAPYWVRLTRAGNLITGYVSMDGTNWVQVASQSITMGTSVYFGLPVCSHVAGTLSTATFDNVTVTSGGGTNSPPTITTHPSNASVTVGQTATFSVSASGSATLTYQWKKNGTAISGATNASYTTSATVIGDNGSTFSVIVTNSYGSATSNNATLTVTNGSGSLPSPWANLDIGSVEAAGSATYSAGLFTIKGAGADIWGSADAFQYVYQSANGDCSITAEVESLQNTDPNAKAAVMIRSDLTAGSAHAMLDVSPSGTVEFIYRTSAGGSPGRTAITGAVPYWLRMTRAGNVFTAYASSNGTTWTTVGSQTITMGTSVYIGMPVCSHVAGTLATATFDNVTVTTSGTNTPPTITTQPTNASVTVGQTATFSVVASGSATLTYQWKKNGTAISGATSAAYTTPATVAGDNGATFSVTVTNSYGSATSNNTTLTVTSTALPSPWANQDIGSVGIAGSASYSGGTFTVSGGGADIWGTADAMQYVYQPASGDCSITVQVETQTNTNTNAKAAVMIRSDLTAGSAHAMLDVSPGGGIEFICRTSAGASAIRPNAISGTAPYWVRMTRVGNVFTAYASPDGSTWTTVGSQTITMGTAVYIGMPVCSHVAGTLSTATFNNVTATP